MDKQFMEMLSGDSLSQARIIMEKLLSMPNCFVGWVQSYNSDKKTVTILPAIKQSAKTVEQAVETYTNRPLYVDVWVLSNALGRPPQIGDKAVCFVLDQKANAFFKTAYNGSQSLTQQTFVPSNNNYRSQNDLCAIIVGEGGGGTTEFADLGGSPYDNEDLADALNSKVTGTASTSATADTVVKRDENGDITSRYIIGTWLQTTATTDLADWVDVFVNSGGWLYKRNKTDFKSDLGIASMSLDGTVLTITLP